MCWDAPCCTFSMHLTFFAATVFILPNRLTIHVFQQFCQALSFLLMASTLTIPCPLSSTSPHSTYVTRKEIPSLHTYNPPHSWPLSSKHSCVIPLFVFVAFVNSTTQVLHRLPLNFCAFPKVHIPTFSPSALSLHRHRPKYISCGPQISQPSPFYERGFNSDSLLKHIHTTFIR